MSWSVAAAPRLAALRLRLPPPPHPVLVLAGIVLVAMILAASAPQLFTKLNPLAIAPRQAFQPPGWPHPFGTDQSGRDIYARVVYGARQSLLLGVGAVALSMSVAVTLGLLCGLGGKIAERVVGWLLDVLFSFPTMILALLFGAHLGNGLVPLIVATGIGNAPGYARMVFGQVLAVRHAGFIEAARALGHSPARTIRRQVLPNALRPLVATMTMGIGQAIVWASALSFLGLGAKPPAAEWGTMLSMGRNFVQQAWWLTFFPGLAIVLTTLATTVFGRALQRSAEGRLR